MELSGPQDLEFLTIGSKVEVSSSEEGFKGSYFRATIVDSEKNNKFLVEYDTLLTEDGNARLSERVDSSSIRPIPPLIGNLKTRFELNDVVDGYHMDGWWVGVIDKVFIDGDRIQDAKKYRVRFENPLHYLDFCLFDLRTHFDWVENKWVSLSSTKQETTEIENGNSWGMEKRDDVRGQCSGYTRKSLLEKSGLHSEKVTIDLVSPSKRQQEKLTPQGCSKKLKLKIVPGGVQGCISADESETSPISYENEESFSVPQGLTFSNPVEIDEQPSDQSEKSLEKAQTFSGPQGSACSKPIEVDGLPSDTYEKISESFTDLNGGGPEKELEFDITVETSEFQNIDNIFDGTTAVLFQCQVQNGNEDLNEDQIVMNCTSTEVESITANLEGAFNEFDKERINDDKGELPKTGEVEPTTPISPPRENNVQHSRLQVIIGNNTVEFSKTLGTPPNSEKPSCGEAATRNQSLPFEKSSPIWEFVDSLEVFKKTPQKPHFRPVLDISEVLREGLALASMVNFSNVVQMICQLKYDSPETEFDIILETLPELEKYGFDVEPLEKRVAELLSIKANIAQLKDQVKDTEIQLMDKKCYKTRLEKEMDELVEKIDESCKKLIDLEEQAMEVAKDYEIIVLRSNISGLLEDARHKFQMLAASSFENESNSRVSFLLV